MAWKIWSQEKEWSDSGFLLSFSGSNLSSPNLRDEKGNGRDRDLLG